MDVIHFNINYHRKENKRVNVVNASRLHKMCKRIKLKKKETTSKTYHLKNCELKFDCEVK